MFSCFCQLIGETIMSQNQDNSKQLPNQQNPSPGQQVQSEPKTPPVQPGTQQSEPKQPKENNEQNK